MASSTTIIISERSNNFWVVDYGKMEIKFITWSKLNSKKYIETIND